MMNSEQDRCKAGAAARDRFHRDYDASVLGPRIRSFLFDIG